MASDITDPAGVRWSVRRRWYPWRRAMSFREAVAGELTETADSATPQAEPEPAEEESPTNVFLQILLVPLGLIVWVVMGLGRVLLYTGAIVLYVVASLVELTAEVAVMPFVLLLRLVGAASWPVQINRQGKHFETRHAGGYGAAASLRDDVAGQIERGSLPVPQPTGAA